MFPICPAMDRALTFTVADLALDGGLTSCCDCRVRILGRAELATLVGRRVRGAGVPLPDNRPGARTTLSNWAEFNLRR